MSVPFRLWIDAGVDPAHGAESMQPAVEALSGGLAEKETLAAFRKAVHLEPSDPDYHYILGEALVRMGRHAEAIPALGEAIRLNPAEATYRYALGAALWGMGRYEDAVPEFREVARLQPWDFRAHNALGAALVRAGGGKDAVGVIRDALRLAPKRAEAHSNLAAALWNAGETAQALQSFRTAVRLTRSSPEALRNLALALGASGEGEEAMRVLRQAMRLRPESAEVRLDLGDVLFAAGRHAEAAQVYDEALQLDPACLRARPASRENRDAITLERAREEVKAEARAGEAVGRTVRAGVLATLRGLLALPRGVALVAWLAALAAVAHAVWRIAPPYIAHHLLTDDVVTIARAPIGDDDILDRLDHAVRRRGLGDRLPPGAFQIGTRSKWRTIRCRYDVPVAVLPGFTRTLHFSIDVEEPYITEKETKFF